jgi:Ni,Fe-hydrogenase I cytochrome b subunit
LRNLWKLAHYIDPLRLRMEFLNNTRNTDQYANDPLAPATYSPAYLFAITMIASPLGWFEVSNLPARYFEEASSINFRRSLRYGLASLKTVLRYYLHKWRVWRCPLFVPQ